MTFLVSSRRRVLVVFASVVVGFFCATLGTAEERTGATSVAPYLLRMERLRFDHDACVLLRRDGQYHFEHLHPDGIRIFEGRLPAGDLASLETLLTKDELFRLKQSDIRVPLVTGDLDQLFISVLRPNHWQNLQFDSDESQRPYRELLKPLLRLLNDIQKEKAKGLTEQSSRNNCLPLGEIQLKIRTGEAVLSTDTNVAESKPAYIVRTFARHFEPSKMVNSCIIIHDGGAYHVRRSEKLGGKEAKTTVLDGTLSAERIHALRVILDADTLRKRPTENPPPARLQAATITYVSIPRDNAVQQITVWQYVFNRASHNIGSLHASDLPAIDDHGTGIIRPLNEWMKNNLPWEKEVFAAEPANPQCMPE